MIKNYFNVFLKFKVIQYQKYILKMDLKTVIFKA